MSYMEMMIYKLQDAQDNNEVVSLSYFVNGGGFCVDITLTPDVMVTGNWIEITDKGGEDSTRISFSLDKNVNYDPELEEYSMEIGNAVIVLSA